MAIEGSLAYELQVVSRRARGYSGLSDSKADDTLLSVGTLHLPLTHAFLLPLNHYSLRIYHEQGGGAGLVAKMCPTLATPWTVARQPPLSMGFSRQEYWSGLLFPSPGDLPNPGIEPGSSALQADSWPTELQRNRVPCSCLGHDESLFSMSLLPCLSSLAVLLFTVFGLYHVACRTLVPQPGIKPTFPALKPWRLNHWTARKVLMPYSLIFVAWAEFPSAWLAYAWHCWLILRVTTKAQRFFSLCSPAKMHPPSSPCPVLIANCMMWL